MLTLGARVLATAAGLVGPSGNPGYERFIFGWCAAQAVLAATLSGALLAAAREELPSRLARVVEYRDDDDTRAHLERMARYAGLTAVPGAG